MRWGKFVSLERGRLCGGYNLHSAHFCAFWRVFVGVVVGCTPITDKTPSRARKRAKRAGRFGGVGSCPYDVGTGRKKFILSRLVFLDASVFGRVVVVVGFLGIPVSLYAILASFDIPSRGSRRIVFPEE